MGTHPIFESDFDCLTDWVSLKGIKTDMEATQPYLCKIQPTVLFQIIDYHERKGANISEKEKSPNRVIGTLCGSTDGGVVTIGSCYKVPHKKTSLRSQLICSLTKISSNFRRKLLRTT